ncbi:MULTISPECIES: radical SAM protein [Methanocorpusculum]|uniref:radical SAM protein n=1 Tax=Methanocorpusculum TaxID=2192 RepID=UPI0005B2D4AB|nr:MULTISPECIES: radical SAM protein [Methanocorpusculum]MDD2249221.1 radical SAM protein [Methanocorpusculum sp.]MDD2803820.1 radical SAM protein [Methanocorpusculum sp.]MDD3047561.1 radical SAM protein [Methanocorpusculum sp.]MEA5087083.1 radical SAM protein [Methanocorpusculum sp.]
MTHSTLKEKLQALGIKQVLGYLDSDPEKNIPKLLKWVEFLDKNNTLEGPLPTVKRVLSDKDGVWYKFITDLYTDIDPFVRKKIFENFIVNAVVLGRDKKIKLREEEGCNIPWAILMDPTSACNLKCIGCWAAEYGNRMNLTLEEWDSIIEQGKALGTYFFLYSGGEPLVRKKDIIRMCEKHSDCVFLSFTNGTLIDEAFADEMLRVGNFVPAISIEGDEAATDARRGAGVYAKVIKAMEILKQKKLPFGISCCYTSANTDIIGSDAYIDDMIARGAKFAWFFTYMPVGLDAVPELLATPEQREHMYHQVRHIRATRPIFAMDFWNDGEYVNGCIAGGRFYLHINANGDIEPCAFIHYSDANIRTHTLLEAYKSPLFMQYRANQPFNPNHLRPCPLLDNPERLTAMVDAAKAKSTDMVNPEDVHDLMKKTVPAAEKWAPVAAELWVENRAEKAAKAACPGGCGCGCKNPDRK